MAIEERPLDVSGNIRLLEWLKAELVGSVAAVLRGLARDSEELILEGLAGTLICVYSLGRRLGVSYVRLDLKTRDKLRGSISQGHELEKRSGDLSALLEYLEGRQANAGR